MMVGMVVFWAAIVFGLVWVVRGGFDVRSWRRPESPAEILERRFAEGEISVDDYRARREVLGNGVPESSGEDGGSPLTTPRAGERR